MLVDDVAEDAVDAAYVVGGDLERLVDETAVLVFLGVGGVEGDVLGGVAFL